MNRKTFLFFAVLLCLVYTCARTTQAATPQPQEEPRIIAPNEVAAGDLVVLRTEVPDGAGLSWAISPAEAVAMFYIDSDKRTAVFASRTKGTYIFALAVAVDGKATCLIHVLNNGLGPGPEPEPEPDPEPDPEPEPNPDPGKRFVMVVGETADRTAAQAATLMGLRDYLQTKKHEYRFVDPDIVGRDGKMPEWYAGYVKYIDAAKEKNGDVSAWLLVGELSADGKTASGIWVAPLPATAAAAIESVKQRGG